MKRSYDNRFWRDENPRQQTYRPRSGFRGNYPPQRARGAYNTYPRNVYQWSNGRTPSAQFGPRIRPLPLFHEDVTVQALQYQPNRHDNSNFDTEPPYSGPQRDQPNNRHGNSNFDTEPPYSGPHHDQPINRHGNSNFGTEPAYNGPHRSQTNNRRERTNFNTKPPYTGLQHAQPLPTRNQEMKDSNRSYYFNDFQDRRKSLEESRFLHTENHDQALYDTVDMVKKKLSDRKKRSGDTVNNNSDTYLQSCNDQDRNIVVSTLPESGESSQRIFTRRPNQSISKLVRERVTTRENCETMKSKIVQQLLKMDRGALQKLIANPRPSSKFECVIHSLLPEYRDSLNKDLRNKAEKSLMHEMNEHVVQSDEMYEDSFMNQMRGLLDPEDTVIISDIKPILMAQLKKTLQTENFDDCEYSNLDSYENYQYPSPDVLPSENLDPIEAPADISTQELPGNEDRFDDIESLENFEPDAVVDSLTNKQESYTGVSQAHEEKSSVLTIKQEPPATSNIADDFEDCENFQFSEEDTRIDKRHTIFNKSININEYLRRSNSKEYDNFDDHFTGIESCSNIKKEQNSTSSDNPLSDSLADFIIENIDQVSLEARPVFFNAKPNNFNEDEIIKDPGTSNTNKHSIVTHFVAHKEVTQLEEEKIHNTATTKGPKTIKNSDKNPNKVKGKAQKDHKVVKEITKRKNNSDTSIKNQAKKLKLNKQLDKKTPAVKTKQSGSLISLEQPSKKEVQNTSNHSGNKPTKGVATKNKAIVNLTHAKSPTKTPNVENLAKLVTIDMFQKIPKTKSDGPKNSPLKVRDKGKPGKQPQHSEVPVKDTPEHPEKKCGCSQTPDTKSQHCQTDNVKDTCILCELAQRESSKHSPSTQDEIFNWIKMIDKAIPELMQKKLSLFHKLPQSVRSKASGMGEFGMTLVKFKTPESIRVEKRALTDKTISHTNILSKAQQKSPPIRVCTKKKKDVEPHIDIPKKKVKVTKKVNKNNDKNVNKKQICNSGSNQNDIITKPCYVKLVRLDFVPANSKSVSSMKSIVQSAPVAVEVNTNNICADISETCEDLKDICNSDDLSGIDVDLNGIVDLDNFNDLSALSLDVQDDTIIADVDIEAITEEVVGDLNDLGIEEPSHQSPEDVVEAAEINIYDYTSDELASDCITVAGHIDGILAIEVVNNNFLASCVDGNIYYFNGADGHMIRTLRGYNLPVTCMIVVEGTDKTTVYSGSLDSRIRSFNLEAGIECSPECNVLSPILTMDKAWDTLFVGTTTGFVLQFECKNNTLIPVSSMQFSEQNIMCLRAVLDGSRRVLLVGARSGHVSVQDAQSGMLLRTLEGPKATVYALLCDANKVICATNAPQMQIYDFTSGVHMGVHNTLRGCTCMRSAGGLLFAGGLDGCVYVYRGRPEPVAQLRGPAILLTSLAIIDCRVIAAYKDRSLFIWKLPPSVLQEMIL